MNINQICDEFIYKLFIDHRMDEISEEFSKTSLNNAEKVRLAANLLSEYKLNHLPECEPRNKKNNAQANKLRIKGNHLFDSKNYFDALELYNHSICMAENDTENITIGYANRSAVYAEWKMYVVCLENIKMARAVDRLLPPLLIDELDVREQYCLAGLKKNPIVPNEKLPVVPDKLSLPENPNIPFIVHCLELKESPAFGRGVITNGELKPGQILAIEEPFINIVLPHIRYERCVNCLKENNLSLLPCKNCTAVMFCSQQCYDEAQHTFHKYECPIIDYLYGYMSKLQLLAIRATIKSYLCFGETTNALTRFLSEFRVKANVFTPNEMYPIDITKEQCDFHKLYHLETNQAKRSVHDLFDRAVITALIYNNMKQYTKFKDILKTETDENVFFELLFRFLQSAPISFHSMGLMVENQSDDTTFGSGVFPFASLINHSCAPNILRLCFNNKVTIVALRCIKPGEQLLDNYGFHHCTNSRKERQDKLQFQYGFICDCKACQENYSLDVLLPLAKIPSAISEEEINNLPFIEYESVTKRFKQIRDYLVKYDSFYPCSQVYWAQESLKICFNVLYKMLPLKLQKK